MSMPIIDPTRAATDPSMSATPVMGPREAGPAPARRFSEVLEGGPELPASIRAAVRDIDNGEKYLDRMIRTAMRGGDFSPQQLIALQARVYRYTQQLEMASKLVEKVTSGLRDTLRSQG